MKTITVNFKKLSTELKLREMKLCFLNNGKLFLEDNQNNLFQMEATYQGSYLDKLIKEGNKINFHEVDNSISDKIENWRKEVWDILEVENFMKRQCLYN